jgi:hypothetical protein
MRCGMKMTKTPCQRVFRCQARLLFIGGRFFDLPKLFLRATNPTLQATRLSPVRKGRGDCCAVLAEKG